MIVTLQTPLPGRPGSGALSPTIAGHISRGNPPGSAGKQV